MSESIFMSSTLKERENIPTKPAGVKTAVNRSMKRRVLDAFISNERGNIKDHVIFDVVIPSIKNAISDVVSDGINMLLFGEKKKSSSKNGTITPYGSFWASSISNEKKWNTDTETRKTSSLSRYSEACWETKEDAMIMLNCMSELIEATRCITVAQFYGLINDPDNFPIESVHNKWGWKTLADVRTWKISEGRWGLTLPRPQRLD